MGLQLRTPDLGGGRGALSDWVTQRWVQVTGRRVELGALAERLVLTRYLRRFLVARNETIKRVAESQAWRSFLEATRPAP